MEGVYVVDILLWWDWNDVKGDSTVVLNNCFRETCSRCRY